MTALVPYLNFDGNCREAMTFYKTCMEADLQLITVGDLVDKFGVRWMFNYEYPK